MRRTLVLAFAVAATFSVLANNFIPVSAPTAEGEVAYRPAGPNGAARLSDQFVPTAAAPIANAPVATTPVQQPDLAAFAPHTSAPATAVENVRIAPVREGSFVSVQATRPSASFVKQRLLTLPNAAVMPDALAAIKREHSVATSLDAAVSSVRENAEPETARAEAKFIPLTAGATNIFASVMAKPLAELPEVVPASVALVDNSSAHTSGTIADWSTERIAFEADVPRQQPEPTTFVTAAYSAPADTIFHRARYVVEPYAPTKLQNTKPEITASTETPSAIFERVRFIPEPTAPVSLDALASSETHSANSGGVIAAEREFDNVTADAAPRQAYVPSSLTALTEVPTTVFQKIGHVAMPEAPAMTTAAAAKEPVLISSQTAMNADLLKPMSAGPLVDAPMLNENAVASTGFSPTPFDRMIDTPDVPEAVLKARPVLISSNNDFSSELLKPMNSSMNPFVKIDKDEVLSAIQQTNNYCDPNFVGPPIRFSQTVELTLDDLLRQLHQRFGVNFIVGRNVSNLPMNIKAGSIPWNVLLKSQLFISGVRARCIDQNTIELVENAGLSSLQDMADVETRFLKLKFLQRTTNSAVGLSGQSQSSQSGGQSGCGSSGGGQSGGISGGGGQGGQGGETAAQLGSSKFDKLIIEIEKILGLRSMQESSVGSMGGQGGQGGGQGGTQQQIEAIRSNRYVTQVPGRNILAIRATKEEHELIDQIIVRADRPPFQVVIKGLVYTANQDRLQDIGAQTTITGGTADGRVDGGIFGPGGIVPPIFDFSAMMGTFDFNLQVTAFQQNGVISIKARPFATVVDGLCTTLNVGTTLLIPVDSGLGGQSLLEEVNATNTLAVAPYVVDDENGNPVAVTLDLTLNANELDTTVTTRGVPGVSTRSITTQLLLEKDQTAILGGFTVDQDRRSVSKTPGLGDIPIIGELFKRRVKDLRAQRLYFAITASVIRYGDPIRPVDVPGATTDPPSITPEQKLRSDKAEPKQVTGP